MKRALILGTTTNSSLAISEIVSTFLSTDVIREKSIDFTCVGFSFNDCLCPQNPFVRNIPIDNPFVGNKRILLRLRRKCLSFLKIDFSLLHSNYIVNELEKRIKHEKFDYVVACAGDFAFVEAGYLFSLKHKYPFFIVYFDPYTDSVFGTKFRKRRMRIESRWNQQASFILYDADGVHPRLPQCRKKLFPFYIPIAKPITSLPNRSDSIVYGGAFYKGLRDPDGIIDLAKKEGMKDFSFEIYGDLKTDKKIPENMHLHERVSRLDFESALLSAAAVIVLGNKTNLSYQPSKFLTDISLRRPILGIQTGREKMYLVKYPFYYDCNDPSLAKKIHAIENKDLLSFDPYEIYPLRDPERVAKKIVDLFSTSVLEKKYRLSKIAKGKKK